MRNLELVDLANEYAWKMVNLPYLWGGDDPILGIDCSGYCILILQGVGRFPHGKDATADGLWRMYPRVNTAAVGCLALFGSEGKATHVAWVTAVIGVGIYILEEGGGGSAVVDENTAAARNAFCRLRQVGGPGCRTDLLGFVDPFLT